MSSDDLTGEERAGTPDGSDQGASDAGGDRADPATLQARIEMLEEENRRLRSEYARARRTRYRRTALALAGLGVVAALGGLVFPDARAVLFALGGTGATLGVLTFYLAPERFLPASLGRSVYGAVARNGAAAVAELGLCEERVYVPAGDGVRLFVPQRPDDEVPDADALADVFVVGGQSRGLSLDPTAAGLVEEFERAVTGGTSDDPATLCTQVADALVEQFELVDTAEPDAGPGRITVAVGDSALGAVDRFDHPVVSFAGTAVARALGRPVRAEVDPSDDLTDYRVTVRWGEESGADGESAPSGE